MTTTILNKEIILNELNKLDLKTEKDFNKKEASSLFVFNNELRLTPNKIYGDSKSFKVDIVINNDKNFSKTFSIESGEDSSKNKIAFEILKNFLDICGPGQAAL